MAWKLFRMSKRNIYVEKQSKVSVSKCLVFLNAILCEQIKLCINEYNSFGLGNWKIKSAHVLYYISTVWLQTVASAVCVRGRLLFQISKISWVLQNRAELGTWADFSTTVQYCPSCCQRDNTINNNYWWSHTLRDVIRLYHRLGEPVPARGLAIRPQIKLMLSEYVPTSQ